MAAYQHGGGWGRCPYCAAPVEPGAAFCRACGRPLPVAAPAYAYGPPPPAPYPPPRYAKSKGSGGCLKFTLVALLGLLFTCVAAAILVIALDVPTRVYLQASGRANQVGGPPRPWDSSAQRAALELSAGAFEAALRARDVEGAVALIDPDQQEAYRAAFTQHKSELPELAAVIATRSITTITDPVAEYQVTDGKRKSSLRFILIDGKWYVDSL